jgi:hypothetical protein
MKPNFSDFHSLLTLRFQPTKGQVCADLGESGELAIHDSNSDTYYGLDPVGARIWGLVADWKTVEEVRETLLEEYDVETSQLESDLSHLLEELVTKKLIEPVPPGVKPPKQSERVIESH